MRENMPLNGDILGRLLARLPKAGFAVAIGPRSIAKRLIALQFINEKRPARVQCMLTTMIGIRS
jgi:hypothetical protein